MILIKKQEILELLLMSFILVAVMFIRGDPFGENFMQTLLRYIGLSGRYFHFLFSAMSAPKSQNSRPQNKKT